MFLTFPHGRFGIGLLLVRLAVCLDCVCRGWQMFSSPAASLLVIRVMPVADLLLAALLFLGLLTPAAGGASALLDLFEAWRMPQLDGALFPAAWLIVTAFFLVSLGVSLLGPGAYSADALLFGRREIVIPHRAPHSRQ